MSRSTNSVIGRGLVKNKSGIPSGFLSGFGGAVVPQGIRGKFF